MKIQDYAKGEKTLSVNVDPYAGSFGVLWPVNRAVAAIEGAWLKFNPEVVRNRVLNDMAESIVGCLLGFVEAFYPEQKLTIDMGQWVAAVGGKDHDLVISFCLLGEDKTPELSEECSESLRYLVTHLQKSQVQLDFGCEPFMFDEDKQNFLDERIDELRQSFSGRNIQQPFGVETCGKQREITSFRERFDIYEGTPRAPIPLSGTAIVDGFCDSENAVLLKMVNEHGEAEEKSRRFQVVSATLIDSALKARLQKSYVKFEGKEIYAIGAKKPTFHLEALVSVKEDDV